MLLAPHRILAVRNTLQRKYTMAAVFTSVGHYESDQTQNLTGASRNSPI